jgi:hypothetical protein
VLADHQVLEVVSKATLVSLVGKDPIEEIAVAEGVSGEGQCALSLNSLGSDDVVVASDS